MKIEAENQNDNISIKFDNDKEIILSSNQTKDLLVTLLQHTIDTLSKDYTRMQNDYLHYLEIYNYFTKNRHAYVYVQMLTGTYLATYEFEQIGYQNVDTEYIKNDLYITLMDFIRTTRTHHDPMVQTFSKKMINFIKEYANDAACAIFRTSKYMDVDRDIYTCQKLQLPKETGDKWDDAYVEKVIKLFE